MRFYVIAPEVHGGKAGLRDLRSLPPALCPQPGGYYIPLWYGHCIHPWRRHPEPDFGCERWEGTENQGAGQPRLTGPGYPGQSMANPAAQEPLGRPWARVQPRMPLFVSGVMEPSSMPVISKERLKEPHWRPGGCRHPWRPSAPGLAVLGGNGGGYRPSHPA